MKPRGLGPKGRSSQTVTPKPSTTSLDFRSWYPHSDPAAHLDLAYFASGEYIRDWVTEAANRNGRRQGSSAGAFICHAAWVFVSLYLPRMYITYHFFCGGGATSCGSTLVIAIPRLCPCVENTFCVMSFFLSTQFEHLFLKVRPTYDN
jgi:hypothetical protein